MLYLSEGRRARERLTRIVQANPARTVSCVDVLGVRNDSEQN